MKYALTYQADEGWGSVDTAIVDDGGAEGWYDNEDKIKEILMKYGVGREEAGRVVADGRYYVRHLDTDITLDINGKIL